MNRSLACLELGLDIQGRGHGLDSLGVQMAYSLAHQTDVLVRTLLKLDTAVTRLTVIYVLSTESLIQYSF